MGDATGPLSEYLTYDVGTNVVRIEGAASVEEQFVPSIFDYLECRAARTGRAARSGLPSTFTSASSATWVMNSRRKRAVAVSHRSPYPDAALVFAASAVVIDHDRRCSHLLVLSPSPDDPHSALWLDRTTAALLCRSGRYPDAQAHRVLTNPVSTPRPEVLMRPPTGPGLRSARTLFGPGKPTKCV